MATKTNRPICTGQERDVLAMRRGYFGFLGQSRFPCSRMLVKTECPSLDLTCVCSWACRRMIVIMLGEIARVPCP